MDDMLTSGEVAKKLGISWSLLWKLEDLGVTPPARRVGRWRIYSAEEVETLRKIVEERRAVNSHQSVEAA